MPEWYFGKLSSIFQPEFDQAADGFGTAGQIILLAAPVV
jgi:hypothetical protein